ncbi:MAG: LytTR family transcriptional regulator, partial [Crocinitomicaceae bacterium]|nr:LytTR family transcriptional regulator [Crocinitomicaceae bacterium]
VTLIGFANSFYDKFICKAETYVDLTYGELLLQNIYFAYAVAFFPILFVLTYFELKWSNHHMKQVGQLTKLAQKSNEVTAITIKSESNEDKFVLSSDSFRFAKVSGNYVEYFTFQSGEFIKHLQRITLSKLEGQLMNSSLNTMKTHRSYIVNLDAIQTINGNAQGYSVRLEDLEEEVPVARNKIEEFNNMMNG